MHPAMTPGMNAVLMAEAARRKRDGSGPGGGDPGCLRDVTCYDGMPLTPQQRVDSYARFAKSKGWPVDIFVGGSGRIVGIFEMGADYRVQTGYYGGYMPTYPERMQALFPEKRNTLHLFSGMVDTAVWPGKTVDINPELAPDYVDDAQTLERVPLEEFDNVAGDPPYSVEDAEHYKTTMVKRNVVLRALGARLRPGAHVIWLDQVKPMYRADQFKIIGEIGICKSTNHRYRVVLIFEKV